MFTHHLTVHTEKKERESERNINLHLQMRDSIGVGEGPLRDHGDVVTVQRQYTQVLQPSKCLLLLKKIELVYVNFQ